MLTADLRRLLRLCLIAAALFAGEWLALRASALLWRLLPALQRWNAGSLPFYSICLVELLAVSALFPEATRTKWWPGTQDGLGFVGLLGALLLGPIGARLLHWALPHVHSAPGALVLLSGGLLDPLAEEWAFRGVLWQASEVVTGHRVWSPGLSAVFTSLLFGLWHVPFQESSTNLVAVVLANVAFGLCLSLARWRLKAIGPGTVVHIVGNAFYLLAG